MHTPRAFEIVDRETLRSFTDQNGFGILVTTHEGEIESTQTPMN